MKLLWLCATGQVFEKLSALNSANGSVWINYSRYGCLWTSHSPSGCNKACLFISVFLMFLRWSSENQSSYQMHAVRNAVCLFQLKVYVKESGKAWWMLRSGWEPAQTIHTETLPPAGTLFPRDHRRASPEQMSPEASEHLLSYDFCKR